MGGYSEAISNGQQFHMEGLALVIFREILEISRGRNLSPRQDIERLVWSLF